MMYDYQTLRPSLFTEEGVELLEKLRRRVRSALRAAGAIRIQEITMGLTGDSRQILAAFDYLVEKKELIEITTSERTAGQHRVFIAGPTASL